MSDSRLKSAKGHWEAIQDLILHDVQIQASLDDIVRLTAHICVAPVAMIFLNVEERHCFASLHGISATETAEHIAFCSAAAKASGFLTLADGGNGSQKHFYGGAPLLTAEGDSLGALCIAGYEPQKLTSVQSETLVVLGKQAAAQIARYCDDYIHRSERQAVEELNRAALDALPSHIAVLPRNGDIVSCKRLSPTSPDMQE